MTCARTEQVSRDELEITAPDKRRHGEALYDLLGKVFSEPGYYRARDMCRTGYINNSHYDWNASRVGLMGERMVTHYGVWGYQMRIGKARVKAGGVGGVATDGDFRKRGLMDRTARASLRAMRELGYDVTLLFGIDSYYHRFGYVRAWSATSYSVRLQDLPAERPAVPIRKFEARPRPDLAELYNRCYATITGTAVRPTYVRVGDPWHDVPTGYLWNGPDGKPAGYVMLSRSRSGISCKEYCGDAEQALRVLALLGRRRRCEEVHFDTIPYDTELAKRLRRGSCRAETNFRRCGGAMIHLLNLPAAMAKLAGELSRRLKASSISDWRGHLLIANERQQVMLEIGDEKVKLAPSGRRRHAIKGGEGVVQLLIGTDAPGEVIEANQMRVSGDARLLAEVLFPAQHPQLSAFDGY